MTETARKVIVCSCEDTMTLDPERIAKGCGARVSAARHLCRSEVDRFVAAARDGALTVTCTQEAPLFREIAEDQGLAAALTFLNVRETGGWSVEGKDAAPKMAALIAAAGVEAAAPPAAVSFASEGVTLILGRDETAIEAGRRLADRLDITVLLAPGADVAPSRENAFPVRRGRVTKAAGHFGAFTLEIDDYAEPAPSSRTRLVFGAGRNGARSQTQIILDLTGAPPLFSAPDLRDGYLRADPADPLAVERAIARAGDLVGTFDRPRYIAFDADLCAHSRSRKVGCRRCLDLCPAGAIAPAGRTVAIDPHVCGGCGACAAHCPTGAAAYAVPPADHLVRRLRALMLGYARAGGTHGVVLLHDQAHGTPLIDALARYGDGLPARVLPLAVNEVTQVGLEAVAALFAYGAAALRFLTRARPRHDTASLDRTIALAEPLLAGLGYGRGLVATIATDDPDALLAALREATPGTVAPKPASFQPMGRKRDVLTLALRELHRAAPAPVSGIALPEGAPLGTLAIDAKGCTLCLSCVSACPTGALGDSQERPLLKLDASLCVQCGLCAATCPEKVIALVPGVDFAAFEAGARTVKEEEPFCCITCGKAFGTKSTIERVAARLEGRHWMFKGEDAARRLALVKMCDTCRIEAVTNAGIDPYAAAPRPPVRTTDDYFREREVAAREAAMKAKIEKGEA
jgi:ferredoxin